MNILMRQYSVTIYRSWQSLIAEIDTYISASDPGQAVLGVMRLFGLQYAATAFVSENDQTVGHFCDLTLPEVSVVSSECFVSYDYTM